MPSNLGLDRVLGIVAASVFLGACIWLISIGHSWEGVILAAVFMVVGALRRKGA